MTNEQINLQDVKRGIDYIGVNVVFYCHDGKGNLLLHRRSAKCRDEQGCWDCGGGSMEFGETFEEAVRREIYEEYGVVPDELVHVTTHNVIRDNHGIKTHWVAVLFAVKVNPLQVCIGEPEKMDELAWFLPENIPEDRHSMFDIHFEMIKPYL